MKKSFVWILSLSLLGCASMGVSPYEEASSEKAETFKHIHLPLVAGTKFKISQGAFGKASHNEPGNEYSWDFDVPFGSDVIAVEDGKVLEVWEPKQGGGCDPKFSNAAHNIKVEHRDGTVAQYVHVESSVIAGTAVKAGQKIGVTANNGWICLPQLHFGVYKSKNNLYDSPNRQTVPVYFEGLPGGIAHEGEVYTAPADGKDKPVPVVKYFDDKSGCFIVRNLRTGKNEVVSNEKNCSEQMYACSTFKIPLALMAFDQKVLKEDSIFKWDGKKYKIETWNQDQTVKSWLENSTVWVSQKITPQLGLKKIQKYLKSFRYGNQDFSGGLTKAWLSSTLKISANEQLDFLQRIYNSKSDLKVSKSAISQTLAALPVEESLEGSEIKGKTGSGVSWEDPTAKEEPFRVGWYIGYFTRGNEHYAFAVNFKAQTEKGKFKYSGAEAKKIAINILKDSI